VRPGDQIDVRVACREKDGALHCASELLVTGQRVASFTLVLKREINHHALKVHGFESGLKIPQKTKSTSFRRQTDH